MVNYKNNHLNAYYRIVTPNGVNICKQKIIEFFEFIK